MDLLEVMNKVLAYNDKCFETKIGQTTILFYMENKEFVMMNEDKDGIRKKVDAQTVMFSLISCKWTERRIPITWEEALHGYLYEDKNILIEAKNGKKKIQMAYMPLGLISKGGKGITKDEILTAKFYFYIKDNGSVFNEEDFAPSTAPVTPWDPNGYEIQPIYPYRPGVSPWSNPHQYLPSTFGDSSGEKFKQSLTDNTNEVNSKLNSEKMKSICIKNLGCISTSENCMKPSTSCSCSKKGSEFYTNTNPSLNK